MPKIFRHFTFSAFFFGILTRKKLRKKIKKEQEKMAKIAKKRCWCLYFRHFFYLYQNRSRKSRHWLQNKPTRPNTKISMKKISKLQSQNSLQYEKWNGGFYSAVSSNLYVWPGCLTSLASKYCAELESAKEWPRQALTSIFDPRRRRIFLWRKIIALTLLGENRCWWFSRYVFVSSSSV